MKQWMKKTRVNGIETKRYSTTESDDLLRRAVEADSAKLRLTTQRLKALRTRTR